MLNLDWSMNDIAIIHDKAITFMLKIIEQGLVTQTFLPEVSSNSIILILASRTSLQLVVSSVN